MKKLTIALLLLVCHCAYSTVITSVTSGSWNNPSTWSLSRKPQKTDSVLVLANHQISMTGNNDSCKSIICYGNLFWASNGNKTYCENLKLFGPSKITGSVLGSLKCKKLFVNANSIIGKVNLDVRDSLIIKDSLTINHTGGLKSFNHLLILKSGTFYNKANESIDIHGDLINNGRFIPGNKLIRFTNGTHLKGTSSIEINQTEFNKFLYLETDVSSQDSESETTFQSNDDFILQGSGKIMVSKLIANCDSLINFASIEITKELKNNKFLINKSNSTLSLGINQAKINGSIINKGKNITINYSRNGDQELIPNIREYEHLIISGKGVKKLTRKIKIFEGLGIDSAGTFNIDTLDVEVNPTAKILLKKQAHLLIGRTTVPQKTIYFNDLQASNLHFHQNSIITYKYSNNPIISSKPKYGTVIIEDGIALTTNWSFTPTDTLVIKGNLNIEQSSTRLNLNDITFSLGNNLVGPGTLQVVNSSLLFYGSTASTGELVINNSTASYLGDQNQEVKVTSYDSLVINKSGGQSIVKAASGELSVNFCSVERGTLNLNSEKCTINKLLLKGTLIFSSRFQDKMFNDITILENGKWDNSYGEDILIKGSLRNNGEFINKKGKIEFTSGATQQISGPGFSLFDRVNIINGSKLEIESDMDIQDTLQLIEGEIFLKSGKISFTKKACLIGESNSNKIKGSLGTIECNENFQDAISNINVRGIGLHLSSETKLGNTKIERVFEFPSNDEFTFINKGFHIHPEFDENLKAKIHIKVFEHEQNGIVPEALQILKSEDFGFTFSEQNSSYDILKKEFTLDSITSFSTWSVGKKETVTLALESINFSASILNDHSILIQANGLIDPVGKYEIWNSERKLKIIDEGNTHLNISIIDKNPVGNNDYRLFKISPSNKRLIAQTKAINKEQLNKQVYLFNKTIYGLSDNFNCIRFYNLLGGLIYETKNTQAQYKIPKHLKGLLVIQISNQKNTWNLKSLIN